jgi:potassium efflux system protein
MGLKDLVNNFACGFFILVERPLRVGDIVNISNFEGEVSHIGSRAVTVRTWDNMHMVVPNTEIFNKTFINWTASDNVVRCISDIRTSRADNPHDIKMLITQVLADQKEILKEPGFEVLLIEISDTIMSFEIRYYVNIRQVRSRISVMSSVLTNVWDVFVANGIKPAYQFQEVLLKTTTTPMNLITKTESNVLAG